MFGAMEDESPTPVVSVEVVSEYFSVCVTIPVVEDCGSIRLTVIDPTVIWG